MPTVRPIPRRLWVALLLALVGVAALLVAPAAQWCVVDGDASACETIGTIVLNVVGVVLIATGGAWALFARATR